MMRIAIVFVLLVAVVQAAPMDPVTDDEANDVLVTFAEEFKSKDIEEKQNAIYNLHDVPHDKVLDRLEKLLKNRDPAIRNVAALAIGGQGHDPVRVGKILMRQYKKDFKNELVLSSVIEAMVELKFTGYWPGMKPALKAKQSSTVVRILDLLGQNRDYRTLPLLLDMYQVAMPKRVKWKTGEVRVDTGAAGDTDQKAAEAAFNKKYGRGGSKEKRKAAAKAKSFDERNFATQLRKCVKRITGQDFDNAIDFEDWYVENYLMCARKAAEMDGLDPKKAVAKAKRELPAFQAKVEDARKKLEEELEQERKAREGK